MTTRRFLMASLVVSALLPASLPIGSCGALAFDEKVERERALEASLRTMRDTIDQRYADRGSFPPTLDALVTEGYLRKLPRDPITGHSDTWVPIYAETSNPGLDAPADSDSPDGPGVWDVRSGAAGETRDGTPYSEL